jgi:predicted aconitase
MVALGTPHFSLTEFERAAALIEGRKVSADVALYISTSRFVAEMAAAKGWAEALERAGAIILVDTCTYFAPAVRAAKGRVMTNSAKWAYYAPGLLPVEVAFGSLEDCIETAVRGQVTRRGAVWSDSAWGL